MVVRSLVLPGQLERVSRGLHVVYGQCDLVWLGPLVLILVGPPPWFALQFFHRLELVVEPGQDTSGLMAVAVMLHG